MIEAFKKDSNLLGKAVAVHLAVIELKKWWHGKFEQVLTGSKALRPYFIRKRVSRFPVRMTHFTTLRCLQDYHGRPIIRVDESYRRSHPPARDSLEACLMDLILVGDGSVPRLPAASLILRLQPILVRLYRLWALCSSLLTA